MFQFTVYWGKKVNSGKMVKKYSSSGTVYEYEYFDDFSVDLDGKYVGESPTMKDAVSSVIQTIKSQDVKAMVKYAITDQEGDSVSSEGWFYGLSVANSLSQL